MKVRGGQSWTYDRLRFLQKNSGGNGLWLRNPDQVQMEDIVIVGTSPFGAGTVGFRFENVEIDSSGNYLHNFIIREFENTVELGADPSAATEQTAFSIFSLMRCRDNDVGALIANEMNSNLFLGCQFRGGVAAARIYGQQRNSLFYGCGFTPFGSPDVMLEIGDPSGTAGENRIRNIVLEGCLFNNINTLGVRWHGGTGAFGNIENIHFRNNRFFESGAGTIINFAGNGPPNGGSFVGNEIAGSPVAIYSGEDHTQGLDEWTDYTTDPVLLTRRALSVTDSGSVIKLEGEAGATSAIAYRVNGLARWQAGRSQAAESGSNTGSDYVINRFADDGSFIANALKVIRATGAVELEDDIECTDPNSGLILEDRTLGTRHRLVLDNGTLSIEAA